MEKNGDGHFVLILKKNYMSNQLNLAFNSDADELPKVIHRMLIYDSNTKTGRIIEDFGNGTRREIEVAGNLVWEMVEGRLCSFIRDDEGNVLHG